MILPLGFYVPTGGGGFAVLNATPTAGFAEERHHPRPEGCLERTFND
jgi:hypothetical protein